MRLWLAAILLAGPLAGQGRFARFDRDLSEIRTELRIPGLAAAVVESGRVVWRKDYGGVTGTTGFLIGSLAETMIAVEVMKLAEKGRLSLDQQVSELPPGATIRRVLSHTADGVPGDEFLYHDDFFNFVTPLVDKPAATLTILDLAKFAIELDRASLAVGKSKAAMFTPVKSPHGKTLPCGLGWFSQTYANQSVVWNFGQTGDSSGLLLKIPARKLTLIALANSKVMSETAHLEDGNVARSVVALAFLKDLGHSGDFERDELVNRALVAFYFGKREESAAILRETFGKFPDLESSNDVTLLDLVAQLQMRETESCATAVFQLWPYYPPAWFRYGMYLLKERRYREAGVSFEQITEHRPPWHHWSVEVANKELTKLQ